MVPSARVMRMKRSLTSGEYRLSTSARSGRLGARAGVRDQGAGDLACAARLGIEQVRLEVLLQQRRR